MIVEFKSRSVAQFLQHLSPLERHYTEGFYGEYVFRGQANSSWRLLPKAFRPDVKTPHEGEIVVGPKRSFRDQRELEWYMLKDFALELNRNGRLTVDEVLFEKFVDHGAGEEEISRIGRIEERWPNVRYHSLLSIAQHYGLPTRLMDWTRHSFTAAYFAASDCVKSLIQGHRIKSLAVYALNIRSPLLEPPSRVEKMETMLGAGRHGPKTTYHSLEVPMHTNQNLHAQKGLFVCCTEYGQIKNDAFTPISLDEYLTQRYKSYQPADGKADALRNALLKMSENSLYKFTLPARLSPELLRKLDLMHVNAASIYPGIDGCARALLDRCTLHSYLP